jgi:hypothetical protein
MTFPTPHMGHSRHGLFFTRLFFSFSFKMDQLSKISSLFFSFESDINFFSIYFLKCLLVFIYLVRKLIFDILGPKFRFLPYFWPQKYIFSYSMQNSRSMDMSHDLIDYGPQIPSLGSQGLFSPFRPPKVFFYYYI